MANGNINADFSNADYKAPLFESTVIYVQIMNDVNFAISVKVQLLLSFKIAVICAFFHCPRPE